MVKIFTIATVIDTVLATKLLLSQLIFIANINFVQLQMNDFLRFFSVSMETMFTYSVDVNKQFLFFQRTFMPIMNSVRL